MQIAARPYLAAGVALVGASTIAISPVAPPVPEIRVPEINLAATVQNPLEVFGPVFEGALQTIQTAVDAELANPAPILTQPIQNGIADAMKLADVVTTLGESLTTLAAVLPDAIPGALDKIAAGDIQGTFNDLLGAGLPALLPFIPLGGTTGQATNELVEVFQRPFTIGEALVAAAPLVILSAGLGAIVVTPAVGQSVADAAMALADAAGTGDPAEVINAFQNGLAGVADSLIAGGSQFVSSANFIRDTIADALATSPSGPDLAAADATTTAAAATVTLDVAAAAPAPAGTQAPSTGAAAAKTPATTEESETSAEDTSTSSNPVLVRDSAKAVPGRTGTGPSAADRSDLLKAIGDGIRGTVTNVTDGLSKATEGTSGTSSTGESSSSSTSSSSGSSDGTK